MNKKPTLLCIVDGLGEAPASEGNAIFRANTPTLDKLYENCPHSQLITHGQSVGLPEGQMGNSEVGHMTIGSGRVMLQSLDKIQKDLDTGAFIKGRPWQIAERKLRPVKTVHLIGMISDGGVHSHTNHAVGLAKLLSQHGKKVFVHVITDGRDTLPNDATNQISAFIKALEGVPNVVIATISGRFYAMDRDNRKERTTLAINAIKNATGRQVGTWQEALQKAKENEETDEFIRPTVLQASDEIRQDHGLLFFNFRADRMRQLVKTFIEAKYYNIVTMTEYDATFNKDVSVLYPPEVPRNTLGEVLERAGLQQLRIAESEKYAHVTFFFNGGREKPFKGEERIVVPSPKVQTYDRQPEMSLPEVTDKLCTEINYDKYGLIVLNIANGDQVGHSGNIEAAIHAVEAIDKALEKILSTLKEHNGQTLIIADHGNCEEMLQPDGSPSTAHSTNPVPCIYVGDKQLTLRNGSLADVAPTILTLMGLPVPAEMEGKCLAS